MLKRKRATANAGWRSIARLCFLLAFVSSVFSSAKLQGGQTLFGEVKIEDDHGGDAIQEVTIVLYSEVGGEVGRQTVSNHSTYRFINLRSQEFELAALVDGNEIARIRISMAAGTLSNTPYGFRQDLEFKWRGKPRPAAGTISATDAYQRSPANQALFQKAQQAVGSKKYDQAIALLRQIADRDKLDFQVWTLTGTVYLVQEKKDEAEKAYLNAVEAKPGFAMALLDLGRLRSSQKRFEEAIDPLTRAVESQPQSPEANFLLGEAYIQIRKGSKAIPCLNEAARLGMSDAHLRLAWLYNAAGLKDKAATEYEEFLKKIPNYADRKRLEEYIRANKIKSPGP